MLARITSIMDRLGVPARREEPPPAAVAEILNPGIVGLQDEMAGGWYNEGANELAPGFAVGAEDVVVDIGCGDGGALNFCAKRSRHVILADIDAERVQRARGWVAGSAIGQLDAHVTDGNPLPLADATATRVICMEVLEHVDDEVAFMAELVRIGRPGARYLITVPDHAEETLQTHLAPDSYFQKPNHVRIFERAGFETLVREAGLIVEKRSSHGFFWAIWWLLFWTCDVPVEEGAGHPMLANWTRTWSAVLASKDGLRIKAAMDAFLPKCQIIVARKPDAAVAGTGLPGPSAGMV